MDEQIYSRVDHYIDELFGLDDSLLRAVLQSTVDAGIPQIQVSPSQGKFLYLLARLMGANKILEIGSLAGYSTIWLGRALPPEGWLVLARADRKTRRGDPQQPGRRRPRTASPSCGWGRPPNLLARLVERRRRALRPGLHRRRQGLLPALPRVRPAAHPLGQPDRRRQRDPQGRGDRARRPATKTPLGARAFNAALAAEPRVEAVVLQVVGAKGHDGLAIARVR